LILLKAISPAEGIGIVRVNSQTRLVRPPYVSSDSPVLPEDSVEDAVLRYGFVAANDEFASWSDLVNYLDQQVAGAREALGMKLLSSHAEMLEVAPAEILASFLDRIESELIPNGLYESAEAVLVEFLATTAWIDKPEIGRRAAQLLQAVKERQRRSEERLSALASADMRFPCLQRTNQMKRTKDWAARIRSRGSVFAPAC
jgi:hypothetical protein